MGKKKNRWSLAPALGLLLLSLATGCGDDEKDEWQTFPGKWEDAEHLVSAFIGHTNTWAEVTIADTGCEEPGVFMRVDKMVLLQDQLVYCYNDWLIPYKHQPGKKLKVLLLIPGIDPEPSTRHALCNYPDSTVQIVSIAEKYKELN